MGGRGPNKHCGQLSPRLNRTLTSQLEIEALPLFVVDDQAITCFTSVQIQQFSLPRTTTENVEYI